MFGRAAITLGIGPHSSYSMKQKDKWLVKIQCKPVKHNRSEKVTTKTAACVFMEENYNLSL